MKCSDLPVYLRARSPVRIQIETKINVKKNNNKMCNKRQQTCIIIIKFLFLKLFRPKTIKYSLEEDHVFKFSSH